MVQTATLPLMLKQLRLSSIARHWQAFLGQAERNGWDSAQYLTALCEQELAERYSRRIARYGKESHLPVGKSLASFDFAQVPGLTREQIEALAGSSDWTRQARNVLLFAASGVGKTHLAAAIGHGLTEQSVRVRYFATTALVQQLQLARTQLRLEDALHKLDRYRTLILDDFGYVVSSDSYRRKEALGRVAGEATPMTAPETTTTLPSATTTSPSLGTPTGEVCPEPTPSG
jgi:DNA replication protein DnaC